MTTDLPPPAVFTHDETLHRILLPPLATFLSALRAPDQLVKLNDILTRFRTPKSYHRVDVRLVESSELPVHDTDEEENGPKDKDNWLPTADAPRDAATVEEGPASLNAPAITPERRARWKLEKGKPIILPEGITVEEYLMQNRPWPADAIVDASHTREQLREDAKEDTVEAAPLPPADDTPSGPAEVEANEESISATGSKSLPQPDDNPLQDSITAVRESRAEQMRPTVGPPVIHPLPPTGPTRRVRELRIDLRTLDAAALFALETWRREMLGLEKLPMEYPDSIWYKDITPSPVTSPAPRATGSGKRRGSPPKKRRDSADHEVRDELDATENVVDGRGDKEPVGDAQGSDAQQTLPDQLSESYKIADTHDGQGHDGRQSDAPDSPIEENNSNGQSQDVAPETIANTAQPDLDTDLGAVESEGEEEMDSPREFSPSPSPDVILGDLFDRRDDLDPEFVPPPPTVQRGIRTAQVGRGALRGGRAAKGGPGRLQKASPRIDVPPEAGSSSRNVPPRSLISSSDFCIEEAIDDTIDLTGEDNTAARSKSPNPGFTPMITPQMSSIRRPPVVPTKIPSTPPSIKITKRKMLLESVTIDVPAQRFRASRKSVHFASPIAKPDTNAVGANAVGQNGMGVRFVQFDSPAVDIADKNGADTREVHFPPAMVIPDRDHVGTGPPVIELDDSEDDEVLVVKRPSTAAMSTIKTVPQRQVDEDDEWGFLM